MHERNSLGSCRVLACESPPEVIVHTLTMYSLYTLLYGTRSSHTLGKPFLNFATDNEQLSLVQEALNSEVYVFLSDVETDVWPEGTVRNLTQTSARWLITRGEHGADEVSQSSTQSLPPHKVASLPSVTRLASSLSWQLDQAQCSL